MQAQMNGTDPAAERVGPLTHLRVVEFAEGIFVPYAARLLADLGAEVIKVENGNGDITRQMGPYSGPKNLNESGLYSLLNAGKTGFGGAVGHQPPAGTLSSLLASADIVLSDVSNQGLSAAGLSPSELLGRNPRLVVATGVTFSRGPSSRRLNWQGLHACAATGISSMIGEADRAPLPLPYDIADYLAGANLAAAALAGAYGARVTGRGQCVQVATADVLFYYMDVIACMVTLGGDRMSRNGMSLSGSGGVYPYRFFDCRDGRVAVACRSARDWEILLDMMDRPPWSAPAEWRDPLYVARNLSDQADAYLEPWFATKSAADLFSQAMKSGLPLAPVYLVADVLAEQQFLAREGFTEGFTVGGSDVRFMRSPSLFSRVPVSRSVSAAPTLRSSGASTGVNLSSDDLSVGTHSPHRTALDAVTESSSAVLDGLLVLDFSWVWSGPMAASSLSDLGANVIKIEHRGRLDNTRLRGRAVVEGDSIDPAGPDEEVSHYFHLVNRGKRSVTLDLKDLAGLDLARRLALKADVIIENLPTGTLPRLGLDYANLSEGNKSLIWVSMSSLGSVGPKRDLRAYAPIMSSLAGAEALSGYEGERPTGMIAASIADPNASTHAVLAILAALNEREVSGTGQFIDIAQTDALISLLCEPLAHLQMTGEQPPCLGSRHSYWVPSGHFPCKDEGSFVALTVHSKDEWSALVALAGLTELAADPECRSAAGRRRRRTDIERALGAWTSSIPRDELVQKLQDAGVPAVAVVEYPEARQSFDDAFQRVDHPYVPGERVVGIPWRFADEPVPIRKSAPLIGEDTASVLREILGLSDETIAGLLDSRATY